MATENKRTALYDWHASHGGRMAPFAGYEMPIQYQGIVAEHTATRQSVGLFDISHMGRLRFDGPRADQVLDHLLTRRVLDMQPGQVRYSLMCNASGGILDDVLVSCLESPSGKIYFLLVVNASNKEKIVRWMQPHLADFPDVEFNDVTDSTAMIAIQGPRSVELCKKLIPASALNLGYYKAKVSEQMSKPCIVSRTGYTGEDGYEWIVRAEDAPRVWENLMLAGREMGISAVGLGARDTLRLEAGMPLYGHELDESVDPYTAGLGFAVQTKDRNFIGRDTLVELANRGPSRKRVGLILEGRRPAREQAQCFDLQGNPIGIVTSGTFSPTLQLPISMAYLAANSANTDASIEVDIRGTKAIANIRPLPFYKRPSP
jgi:aminomethyltransferase